MRLKHLPHVFPMKKRPHAQVHHVPRCVIVIAHQVEGHGNMGMAVVEA